MIPGAVLVPGHSHVLLSVMRAGWVRGGRERCDMKMIYVIHGVLVICIHTFVHACTMHIYTDSKF